MKVVTRIIVILLVASVVLTSCEDVINPDLQEAKPQLVVEAWLNDKPGNQVINLSMTQPYFENTTPPGVSGALVAVQDSEGNVMSFVEDPKRKGYYTWTPSVPGGSFGVIGRDYELTVSYNGETFESMSTMGRAPVIDSISVIFEEESTFFPANSYSCEFWANDLPGSGDAYWIKTFKNDTLLNKPSEISLAFDAGFSPGGDFDGITFLPPIRSSINPFNEDANGDLVSPYLPGDSIYVEIQSITYETFIYLNQVVIQTDRPGGFSELFSSPLSNVPTNITNVNPNGSKPVGYFNVGAVSGLGKKVKAK